MKIDKNKIIEKTNKLISKKITEIMKQEKLSVEEFAEKTGLRVHRIKSLLNKTAKRIFLSEILKIVRTFNISFKEFFRGY